MDGLCTSEHTPGPGLTELKKVYQPVTFHKKGNSVLVKNGHDFLSLENFQYTIDIMRFWGEDEARLTSFTGQIPGDQSGPGSTFLIDFSGQSGLMQCDTSQIETWLRIKLLTQQKLPWAAIMHEIAWAEFRLDEAKGETISKSPVIKNLQLGKFQKCRNLLQISGLKSAVTFDTVLAKVTQWSYKGVDLILEGAGPQLTFWRAPMDNDEPSAARIWRDHGLHMMTQQVRSVRHQHCENSGLLEIIVESWIAPPVLAWGFATTTSYTIPSEGRLEIHVRAVPKGINQPRILPRVGLEMMLPKIYNVAQWFGLGPGQGYRDMKEACKIGIWECGLDEMMFMYEMPQENGNRTETRWVKVKNKDGAGIKATLHREKGERNTISGKATTLDSGWAEQPSSPVDDWEIVHQIEAPIEKQNAFDFALSEFTARDLDQAQHPYELKGSKGVVLRIDDDHHGLGTASCGPDTLEKYQLKMRTFEFTVTLEATGL